MSANEPPLRGLRVLELARVLAGPWAGQLLADLGADVVKVERPGEGDDTRSWGPPFVEGADGANLSAGYFHSTNRGKRSITVAFETEEGRRTIHRLARHADVVIENFKVGSLKKYGLDYAGLSKDNPRIVYCSVTGFGQDGPYAPLAGYDFMVQGMSGFMSINGEPKGEPIKTAVAYADVFTGMYASVAVLAALRKRDETGLGCHIDMALLDTQLAVLGNQALYYLISGASPARMGNEHATIVPYQVVPTSDGHIIIACGNDGQFHKLCEVLGTSWADDPSFATNPLRVRNRAVLIPLLIERTRMFAKADLLARFDAVKVPAGPINSLAEAFADPQVIHRGMRVDLPDAAAKGGSIPTVRSPIVLDGVPMVAQRGAPALGADTADVLSDPDWGG